MHHQQPAAADVVRPNMSRLHQRCYYHRVASISPRCSRVPLDKPTQLSTKSTSRSSAKPSAHAVTSSQRTSSPRPDLTSTSCLEPTPQISPPALHSIPTTPFLNGLLPSTSTSKSGTESIPRPPRSPSARIMRIDSSREPENPTPQLSETVEARGGGCTW